jgi:zinc protease
VLLGESHPYSRRAGEVSLQALTIDDVKDFHAQYFLPNNTSLAVVGNVSKKELQPLLEKAFKNWKQGVVPRLPDVTPRPLPQGIYLVEAPKAQYIHAEERTITGNHIEIGFLDQRKDTLTQQNPAIVFASLGAPIGAFDEEAMLHALPAPEEQHIPNKFATLLVPTFTVSSSGFEKFLNRLTKSEAKSDNKSDHPVQAQMPPDSLFPARQLDFMQHTKRLLDSGRTRAVLVQNALMNGIKPEYVLAAPERIKAVAASDMREAAQKYLGLERLTMIVIGSPDLLNPLVSLGVAQSRVIFRFSENLEPILTFEKSDLTLPEITARHLVAVGGTTAVASLQSLTSTSELQLSAMGQKFPGTIITKQKLPNKITRILEIPATQMLQALWYDGTKAFDKIEMMGSEQPMQQRQAKETESALFDAQIFPLLGLPSCGFTAELLGKREGQFIIKASAANGTIKTLMVDETTYFLSKIEETRQTPQGIVKSVQEFRDYEKVSGVQLPSVIVLRTGPGTLIGKTRYQVNPALKDEEFLPK